MTGPAVPRRRARLDAVGARRLMIGGLILALLWGTAAWESVAGASGPSDPVAQEQSPDTGSIPFPSDSDDEVRLVMALLIAVAAAALLGTFVYWVRTGDSTPSNHDDSPESAEPEDTLG